MHLLMVKSRMHAAVRARALVAVACGMVGGVTACNGADRRGEAPDTVQQPSAERRSPRLDKPVTDYTGQEFQTLISGL
jgi:hypothetical protein